MYRICVCGGRDYNDYANVFEVLGTMLQNYPKEEIVIINGDSRGADKLAQIWAEDNDIVTESYPANWDIHGKAAGPIRNQQMLDTGIDVLVAFPGGRGTEHMVKICKDAGVFVFDVAKDWKSPTKREKTKESVEIKPKFMTNLGYDYNSTPIDESNIVISPEMQETLDRMIPNCPWIKK